MSAHAAVAGVQEALAPSVQSGHLPGYAAGISVGGETEVFAAGELTIGSGEPMGARTLFRIASLTKPVAAALALSLIEDGKLELDEAVAGWLPELATPRVLKRIDGPLQDSDAVKRPILVRDLLTMTAGFGLVLARGPLRDALIDADLMPGPFPPAFSPGEFMARLGVLPLADQPGEGWLYHTAADVLAVLITRAGGRPLSEQLRERITAPLGMSDTGFVASEPARLASAYAPSASGLKLFDPPGGKFSRPPAFEALGSGLVSTIPDYLAFQAMLVAGGGSVLSPESVAQIGSDQLTGAERDGARAFLGPGRSWGFMVELFLEPGELPFAPGTFGWMGGTGTTAYIDPAGGLYGALFTQRAMESNRPTAVFQRFWRAVYDSV